MRSALRTSNMKPHRDDSKLNRGLGGVGMSRCILLVDDEETILFAMKQYCTLAGYEVDCAQDRHDAIALLTAVPYAVLITDICLTGNDDRDGFAIVRYAQERCPETHIRTVRFATFAPPVARDSKTGSSSARPASSPTSPIAGGPRRRCARAKLASPA